MKNRPTHKVIRKIKIASCFHLITALSIFLIFCGYTLSDSAKLWNKKNLIEYYKTTGRYDFVLIVVIPLLFVVLLTYMILNAALMWYRFLRIMHERYEFNFKFHFTNLIIAIFFPLFLLAIEILNISLLLMPSINNTNCPEAIKSV